MLKKTGILVLLVLASFSSFANSDTLKIFSWNIFMVPPFVFKSDQFNRAKMIGEVLDRSGADVIILQEVFMEKTRKIIEDKLSKDYLYNSGKPQGGNAFKGSSGVWILSRLPLEDVRFVKYKDCKGSDCFSKKGAYVFSVTKNGHQVYIAGTHVQSGPAVVERQKQFNQLVKESAHVPDDIPFLIIGDLNTDLYAPEEYKAMLDIFKAGDGSTEGEQYSYFNGNDLAKRFFGGEASSSLDYILVRDNTQKISSIKRTIHKFTSVSFGTYKFNDLSDHYALTGEVVFK
jgi:endonuclease/exonuclease/phosphatase family metal-dependent hydrolase